MTLDDFIAKWTAAELKESAAAHEHFTDLCRLLGEPTPAEADPTGDFFTFEKHVSKVAGGKGYADVWKRGHFAWEYKGKRANLERAYDQLVNYRRDLENPPLLIVCDLARFRIHTNFTGTTEQVYDFTLADLRDPATLRRLTHAFRDPEKLNPKDHREKVTRDASETIGHLALSLRDRGHDPQTVAHFLMQLVFAFFAEDVGLLPGRPVKEILDKTQGNPALAMRYLAELFAAMAQGGNVLLKEVPHFNGGLFVSTEASQLPLLENAELAALQRATKSDWLQVEPAIFGTLFERSLDPDKRSQLGAHYTSRADILRIVRPVIIDPLEREWLEIRDAANDFIASGKTRSRRKKVSEPIANFLAKLHDLKVLDPACGSGNFLYVALQQLKELEKQVVTFAQSIGEAGLALLGPKQFYGLEKNVFAHELASIVVWIGYLQWNHLNGLSNQQTPILEKLDNIRLQDALINDDGTEAEWPDAEFIVGNPPFLGGKRMRSEFGDEYVEQLFETFDDRVPREADFVTYWFEKARAKIERDETERAGLLSTNSIRGGASRKVLERIKETGDIFMAWSDEAWILDGAAVRVSLVAFDDGSEEQKKLDNKLVETIHPDLTAMADLGKATKLEDNSGIAFMATTKGGAFDISGDTAREWLKLSNPGGQSNEVVVKPWMNTMDVTREPRDKWIIDFALMSEEEASQYIVPFEYVRENVKPARDKNKRKSYRENWWRHAEPRPTMRSALEGLKRFIATPTVSKYRIFVWLDEVILPDHQLIVFARDDDFTFGVLHSKLHETWSLAMGTWLGKGNDPRYTPTTCFETFPFPHPIPEQRAEVEKWAGYLDEVRGRFLEDDDSLTLTKLYNQLEEVRQTRDSSQPAYALLVAHDKLDAAVAAAYGWDWPLEKEEVLERLLGENRARAHPPQT